MSKSSTVGIMREQIRQQLLHILPADCILYQEEDLRPYECDALSAYRKIPLIAEVS